MSRPEDKDEGGFLGRWARRKQEVQKQEALKQPPPADPPAVPAPSAEPKELKAEAELPLPSLDSIVPGSDVSAFFAKHVPEALRTAALRKLWVTDPQIKNFIEMADYQWDFNNPDAIPGWSSSVGDFDAKRLIERIMGGEKQEPADKIIEAAPHHKVEDDAAAQDDDGDKNTAKDISENTDFDEKSVTSLVSDDAPASALIQNGAVQNIATESIVYETVRKRHGRALPS